MAGEIWICAMPDGGLIVSTPDPVVSEPTTDPGGGATEGGTTEGGTTEGGNPGIIVP